jgi:hypothetical protein
MSASGQYQTAVATNGSIYVSINFGNTWTTVSSPTNKYFYSVSISATGQYQTVVDNTGFIWRSIATIPNYWSIQNGILNNDYNGNININRDATFTSSNPPISFANQPLSTDNSNKIPTTSWVQSAVTTSIAGLPTLSGSNSWTGNTNTFNLFLPTSILNPVTNNEFCRKGYCDTNFAQLAQNNTYSGIINLFNGGIPTISALLTPTTSQELINKGYADTTYASIADVNTAYLNGQEPTSVIYLYDDFLSSNSVFPSGISGDYVFNGTGGASWSIGTTKLHPGIWTLTSNRAIGFLSSIPSYLPNTIEWIARITSNSTAFSLYAGIAQGYSNFTNSAFFGHISGETKLYASINNVNLHEFVMTLIQNNWYSYKITFNNPNVTFTIKNITDNITESYTTTADDPSFNFNINLFPQYQQSGTVTSEVDYLGISYQTSRT